MNSRESIDIVNALKKLAPPSATMATWDKASFFSSLPERGTILDVGCGNNSPFYTKKLLPAWHYIGLDVGDYNQSSQSAADEYIIVPPDAFTSEIERLCGTCDAVVSSHNIEHCDERNDTIAAMARALKIGGRLFMSFPAQDSTLFPKRGGCLNYYDDCTHKCAPPDFGELISILHNEGLFIQYATTRYQPTLSWIEGLQNEADSNRDREVKSGTWALWGFESIIWAEMR
jgi:SAM-dependent methyltransferase